jgi:hypothetical protein
MDLAALLEDARTAPTGRRIELRDRIAAYGIPAIEGVRQWLGDKRLSAFAVRVIERVGIDGEAVVAGRVLRSARTTVPESVRGDVEWALQRIKAAARPAPPRQVVSPSLPAPRREAPLYTVDARRQAG